MSGYTKVVHRGAFYELALTTPNISFAIDPRTGSSPETRYHAEAQRRFERIFADKAAFIEQQLTTLRDQLGARVTLLPMDATERHRVQFMVRELSIDLVLNAPPELVLRDELAQRLRDSFILEARLLTSDYEATLETSALDGAELSTLEATLTAARADLDAVVIALRAEQAATLPILPYDGALPLFLDGKPGACRLDLRVEVPRGAELLLALPALPTPSQRLELIARWQRLELERIRQNHAREQSSVEAPRGWWARLFKRE